MSFHDLPADWPRLPLDDPGHAADIVDLVVSDADRSRGGVGLLLCRPDRTLAQPVFVHDLPDEAARLETVTRLLRAVAAGTRAGGLGGAVLGLAHPGPRLTDEDRRVHQVALDVAREEGARLLDSYLVTPGQVRLLPVDERLDLPAA